MVVGSMLTLRLPETSASEDEHALVAQVRAGDEAAFESLFRRYAVRLLNLAYPLVGSKDDAEDVVQEVFAKLWMARERWELRGALIAYLMLATRNVIRDGAKHDRVVAGHRTTVLEHSQTDGSRATCGPDDELEARETAAAIQTAIAALAPQRRAVCTLRWTKGMSYAEIAKTLNLAPKTVERHLALAYKELCGRVPGCVADK
jgi:RNA polymerase sigma-70 factor (ECF subfamily)